MFSLHDHYSTFEKLISSLNMFVTMINIVCVLQLCSRKTRIIVLIMFKHFN
jgi:hypothetical protein